MDARHLQIGLCFAFIYVAWGTTYFAMAVALEGFAPLVLAAIRFLVAGALVLVLASARGSTVRPELVRPALLPGLLFFTCANGAICWAESRGLPTSQAATLVASMPLWIAALGRVWAPKQRQGLTWAQRVGLVVGFAGTAVLAGAAPSEVDPLAALVVVAAAIAWASGSLIVANRSARERPGDAMTVAGLQMVAGGLGCAVVAVGFGESLPVVGDLSPSVVGAFAYLVLAGSVIGFLAYGFLLRNVTPARVATYAYVNPVVAVVIGVALGEPVTTTTLTAMLLVVLAVAITVTPARRARRPDAELTTRLARPIGARATSS